jgi:hypothetical protein
MLSEIKKHRFLRQALRQVLQTGGQDFLLDCLRIFG